MSLVGDAIRAGWLMQLSVGGTSIVHTHGTNVAHMMALDNGSLEEIASLAMAVEGVNRSILVTRDLATYAQGDTVSIGSDTYRVLAVRPRSDCATELLLGATIVAGRQ